MHRNFRFGVVGESIRSGRELAGTARRAEELGYDVLTLRDHFVAGPFGDQLAPMVALASAAAATSALRLGTMVLSNDFRHPVMLAKEAATLDHLSDGRFELGLGAGWLREEYEAAGMAFDRPGTRVGRLAESLQVLRGLLSGEKTTFTGEHYTIDGLAVFPRPERRPPLVVGAGSRRMLGIAGRYADTVGILPRALPEGTISEEVSERLPDTIARKVDWVREAAAGRDVELSMMVTPTFGPDPRRAAAKVAVTRGWGTSSAEVVLDMPSQFVGPPEHIAEQMLARRDRFGFTYYQVSDAVMEAFAPVIPLLAP
ncbi:TIGR03621 family F420-dependent LLM class oxidoreductase [Actinomadura citrea]|jgi:probable F420-dependent oxidoreductase|uniref:Putative F420-dependent oxidoreductase n=1 Tax=Actinomadura citrea TaxID=46158 RepID=A0A7Y9KDH7_9ACTN|nr:TIGR03621 family F420-dependent LLM class oxidoreductase [Actinomadura citrea]NYE13341.1 putative F420-dependent oxidoreductase [Actinomadura citrea]GGU05498.1 LLM class F420-dependent oxidoreductase [Actinomadura citrea]